MYEGELTESNGSLIKADPSATRCELNVFIGMLISYLASNICYWDISCFHGVLSIGALLIFVGSGWPDELTHSLCAC